MKKKIIVDICPLKKFYMLANFTVSVGLIIHLDSDDEDLDSDDEDIDSDDEELDSDDEYLDSDDEDLRLGIRLGWGGLQHFYLYQ